MAAKKAVRRKKRTSRPTKKTGKPARKKISAKKVGRRAGAAAPRRARAGARSTKTARPTLGELQAKLWHRFRIGLRDKTFGADVIAKAEALSEPHVRRNLALGSFDSPAFLRRTLDCAERCGEVARGMATGEQIDAYVYTNAFEQVRGEQMQRFARASRRAGLGSLSVGGACG
jgi:hypothetical protein